MKAEGTDGKDGVDGKDGTDGKDGADGKDGEDGVSVVGAYVDEDLHLWIVLSNDKEIDAGYVGVSVTPPEPEPEPEITEPTIIVSSVKASAGETVDVTIDLKNNPGVSLIYCSLEYDDGLTLTNITCDSTTIGGNFTPPPAMNSPVDLTWYNALANTSGDSTFVTLTFKVADGAASGDYAITLTYSEDDISNFDEDNVDFDVINGKITVS